MVNLIQNENMKVYRRWRTWIMVGIMIGIVFTASILDWHYDKTPSSETWQKQVEEQKADAEKELADPKTDEGSKKYYKDRIALIDYRLEHDIRPEVGTMWSGINGSATLVILITLFMVIIAGDSLAGEFSTGTIKLLLIRPANRLKILISKYISMILFGIFLLIVLFVVSVLINGLLYQFGDMNLPLVGMDSNGDIFERNMLVNLWKTYMLNGVSTVMYVTIAFMISSAFRSSAMAIGTSVFLLFAGNILTELIQRYDWAKYVLFANINLSQYLEGRPYQDGMTLSFSVIMLVIYFVVFNLVSWLAFTRRDVAA
ncbi:ABC transporter permease [Paenibacillus sp. CF384]|uniref:ABC transporter permease n=1 Tax=Paenibacillus sp. CF384 TaxID=1884382 RepID=UPI00089D40C8|nr:ABC transporter permease [Paenibacillus sp. CF384]SDW97959.1 ABC-2 type transport system permease protein [Paenibacillus sp. CF384]